MKNHNYYVYILAKERNSTFYTGVTNNLQKRVYEHKEGLTDGFTKKYGIWRRCGLLLRKKKY